MSYHYRLFILKNMCSIYSHSHSLNYKWLLENTAEISFKYSNIFWIKTKIQFMRSFIIFVFASKPFHI